MATTTKFTCDRCGGEAGEKLPTYSLQYEKGYSGHVHCTWGAELCQKCHNDLQRALKAFHEPWVYLA